MLLPLCSGIMESGDAKGKVEVREVPGDGMCDDEMDSADSAIASGCRLCFGAASAVTLSVEGPDVGNIGCVVVGALWLCPA